MKREIYVETPSVSDALHLMVALPGLPTKLLDRGGRKEVEIRPLPDRDQTRLVLDAAARWLGDRKLASTRVRFGGNSYRLLPDGSELPLAR
jgi:hypothetical protein